MLRNILTASVAALTFAAPTLAKPGAGGAAGMNTNINAGTHGPSQSGIDARVNSQGPANASQNGIDHASPNSVLQTNSTTNTTLNRSQQRASTNAVGHANTHSSLARGAVSADTLTGLNVGTAVQANGTTLGNVSQIVTGPDGSIRLVIVTSTTTHQTYRIAPSSLSLSGGVWTTTSM